MARSSLTLALVVAGIASAGCTLTRTEIPPFAGPSELGLSLALAATPDVLVQDGSSKAVVTVSARDASSRPVAGLSVTVHVEGDDTAGDSGRLSHPRVTTDADGRATFGYIAPHALPGSGVGPRTVTVVVTPIGSDFANALPRSVLIRLVPPRAIS